MKRFVVFAGLFLIVSLFSFASAATSSTQLDINVPGCTVGGESILPGACSVEGNTFCTTAGVALNTVNDPFASINKGCAFGDVNFKLGDPQCCPAGYVCNQDGTFSCDLRTVSCASFTASLECGANSCFWIDQNGGFCADKPSDYGCSVYENSTFCAEDALNLGQVGFGTGVCGSSVADPVNGNYVVPQNSCSCQWDTTNGCELSYKVTQDIYTGANANSFTCDKNFTAGFCIDGLQDVSWNSSVGIFNGWAGGVPQTLLDASSCSSGNLQRSCGDPIITLPGFSFFALISSIGLIGLFYFFRREEK